MKTRKTAYVIVAFIAICIGAFFAPFLLAPVSAQRVGYVERASDGAFASHLAPNPVASKMLISLGTSNRVGWADQPTGLPTGTTGQIAGVASLTGTRTVVTTGTQTSVETETYSYTETVTRTETNTATETTGTGTYTFTGTGTSTGLSTSGSVSVENAPRGLSLYGNTLYLSGIVNSKFQTINVSNPASMSVINTYSTCTTPYPVAAWNSSVLVGCENNRVELWGCADPNSCTKTYDFSVDDYTRGIAVYSGSNYALISNSNDNTVQVLNLSNGTVAGTTSAISGCGARQVAAISSSKAALSCVTSGRLYIIDYTTPSSPQVMGFAALTTPLEVYAFGGRYVAVTSSGANSVYIIDANDPNSPSSIGNVSTGTSSGYATITGQGAFLYVTLNTDGTMLVIDISDLNSPSVVGTISVGNGPNGIAVSGDWAFVALTSDNLVKSVDVSHWKTLTGTQVITQTMTVTVTNTGTGTGTGTQTYATTGIYTNTATATGTTTGTEWKAVNGTIYAGSNVTLSKGTSTVTDTSVAMAESPTIHSVSSNVPGGDLFMYAYTDFNQIAFAASPEPAMDADSYVTATTSPTYFLLSGQNENISVVNHFEDTTSQKVWISRGSIFYSFPLKASAPVTTHAVFGICTKVALVETLESTIQDVSFSVTSSDWSVFTGAIALPSGLLIPSEHRLCLRIYSQTTSGSATSYLGTSYVHQTWLNGPWIKSGANAWAP